MKIGLFIPCYVNQFYPKVGIATLELLEGLGMDVEYPMEQTCCGQPIANSGMEKDAIPSYQHFVRTFKSYDYIVAPSGSCTYHVRNHYDIIPQMPDVEKVRSKTLDLVEFLNDVIGSDKIRRVRFPHKAGLHQSCHGLRGLRLAQSSERVLPAFSKWENLLGKVEGLLLVPIGFPDECCGFGGTFSVMEPEVSSKMGADKVDDYLKHGVEYIISGDMSCLMHLNGIIQRRKLPLKTIHIAEVLNSHE